MAAGPFARLLAQAMIMGGTMFSRAFLKAYQEAVKNAQKGGAGAAAQGAIRRLKMQESEALGILNLKKPEVNAHAIQERFQHLYDVNDPSKGGSFYLQSKVFRAKEVLEYQMRNARNKAGGGAGESK
uniref:Mitochondrial import inner membrane translocase subunit TIM16 n=1 Tax=Pinguiococcus pyrenoidosus TaxID=172671 RepID=A0A7R9U2F3_9STRA|mmetsp:Transcript_1243/g.5293  ORF Transcript_1243/g.5293 Transcript_1243/m.5293 type:complete len:127 (+) Transcript_1243:103-483(+)